jgi:hypothetical protein
VNFRIKPLNFFIIASTATVLFGCGGASSPSSGPAAISNVISNVSTSPTNANLALTAAPSNTATSLLTADTAPVVIQINEATSLVNGKSSGIATVAETQAFVQAVTTVPTMSEKEAFDIALKLWRNDDLTQHPKGSCAGCHGADFFDLSRIGTTETDVLRRAQVDGATPAQAKALAQAIKDQRVKMNLPATNARTFRPFQPNGSVLLPNLTDPRHIVQVKRDIAFAQQFETLLPTLMGSRIASLAEAKRAKTELLDVLSGTNIGGANPKLLNLRKLPTGIQYPLWSADFHQGTAEGTFNDWVADISHDAKPDKKAQWIALQDAYLADPSNVNFWNMYAGVKALTQSPTLGACNTAGLATVNSCATVDGFITNKLLSSMMGQHMLRLEAAGKLDTFVKGPVAFSYLDNDPAFAAMNNRGKLVYLPANLWEIGDTGRSMLAETNAAGSFKANLKDLGFPEFAQNSIDQNRSAIEEERDIRLAWFWVGMTFDSSFARINGSNATRVGEYMVGTLVEDRMFNHMAFSTLARLVTKGFVQEANMVQQYNSTAMAPTPPKYIMEYGYAWGYGRTVADNLWNEDKTIQYPADLKAQMNDLFGRLTGNGFRMSLYLQLESLDSPTAPLSAADVTNLKSWLDDSINQSNGSLRRGAMLAIQQHFARYHAASQASDQALMDSLRTRLGITTTFW